MRPSFCIQHRYFLHLFRVIFLILKTSMNDWNLWNSWIHSSFHRLGINILVFEFFHESKNLFFPSIYSFIEKLFFLPDFPLNFPQNDDFKDSVVCVSCIDHYITIEIRIPRTHPTLMTLYLSIQSSILGDIDFAQVCWLFHQCWTL